MDVRDHLPVCHRALQQKSYIFNGMNCSLQMWSTVCWKQRTTVNQEGFSLHFLLPGLSEKKEAALTKVSLFSSRKLASFIATVPGKMINQKTHILVTKTIRNFEYILIPLFYTIAILILVPLLVHFLGHLHSHLKRGEVFSFWDSTHVNPFNVFLEKLYVVTLKRQSIRMKGSSISMALIERKPLIRFHHLWIKSWCS